VSWEPGLGLNISREHSTVRLPQCELMGGTFLIADALVLNIRIPEHQHQGIFKGSLAKGTPGIPMVRLAIQGGNQAHGESSFG
jgi:hypothetical protein